MLVGLFLRVITHQRELRARIQGRNHEGTPATCWLAFWVSHCITQDYLSQNGTSHGGLSPPTPISDEDSPSQTNLIDKLLN